MNPLMSVIVLVALVAVIKCIYEKLHIKAGLKCGFDCTKCSFKCRGSKCYLMRQEIIEQNNISGEVSQEKDNIDL